MTIKDIHMLIGQTPMVELKGTYGHAGTRVYIKLEKFNLGGSVKDRAALGMIEGALARGDLKPGGTLIEPTSGNTGIALALIGNLLGIKVKIVMPETMSKERRQFITAYGADLILTPGDQGMKGAIERARHMVSQDPSAYMPMQFSNPDNATIHYRTTGPEILNALPNITTFVAGVGTGGTITGVGRYLKEHARVEVIAVEPSASPVLSGGQPGSHKLQGIGAGFVPDNFDPTYVDTIVTRSDDQGIERCQDLARNHGLLLGLSSGAAVDAALDLAKHSKLPLQIVVLSPDGGEKYMSLGMY